LPRVPTYGSVREIEAFSSSLRTAMVGYGYIEVMSLSLSSERDEFKMMRREETDDVAKILNPISEDLTCTRVSLVPSIFRFLQANKHRDLPQSVFEVGDCIHGEANVRHLAALTIHPKASFTEMKSLLQSVFRDAGAEFELRKTDDGAFIPGRAASLIVDGKVAGSFGEYHPQVIGNFELTYPVAGFEISLDSIL